MVEYVMTVLKAPAWLKLRSDDRAVTALEYGLLAALIAGVIITAVALLGTNLSTVFNRVANSV